MRVWKVRRSSGHPDPVDPDPLPADEAARLGRAPDETRFITGNGLASLCRHVFNYEGFTTHPDAREEWWFCKLDNLDRLLAQHPPPSGSVLLTHNSDYPVGRRHEPILRRHRLRAWFAANVELEDPRLIPVPLGIANPGWEHGDSGALLSAQEAAGPRAELVDVSFSLDTNPQERGYCLEQLRVEPAPRVPHRDYLARLASTYFCISPSGHGLDTHRTWEALYLRTVPVVRRSALTAEYTELPWIVVDDWAELRSLDFSPELYERVMGQWHPSALSLGAMADRMRRRLDSLARSDH